jgi:N-dimethylarginine dimethylaminohydrolase
MGEPAQRLNDSEPLPWGYRYLMCAPEHFDVLYEINPWMHVEERPDPDRAAAQWERLVEILAGAGAELEFLPPLEGLPDLVFTANGGLVDGPRVFGTRFRYPERRPETAHFDEWFRQAGFELVDLPVGSPFFEAGDAIPFGGALIAGYGFRSEAASYELLGSRVGAAIVPARLVSAGMYHLDVAFCPLDSRRALVARSAFDRASLAAIAAVVPEPLFVEADEAATFCCNSAVVGRTIVMPACPPRVGRILEAWGFEIIVADVREFEKSGGAVSCLALALDTRLTAA